MLFSQRILECRCHIVFAYSLLPLSKYVMFISVAGMTSFMSNVVAVHGYKRSELILKITVYPSFRLYYCFFRLSLLQLSCLSIGLESVLKANLRMHFKIYEVLYLHFFIFYSSLPQQQFSSQEHHIGAFHFFDLNKFEVP